MLSGKYRKHLSLWIIIVITSISNEKVKFLRSLADSRARRESGYFIAEGANLVKDIPQDAEVLSIYVKESKEKELSYITEKFTCEKIVLEDSVFDRVSQTVTPIGIIAVVKMPKKLDLSALSAKKVMVLDQVSDAGNVGAIIRTAVAAGYNQIVFIGGADPYSPKAVRASMSAVFKAEFIFCDNNSFLCSKNISEYDIIVLDMGANDIFGYTPNGKFVLVVGNEAHGVSAEIVSTGRVLSIPMQNMESLNAAVSAGIAMYVLGEKVK